MSTSFLYTGDQPIGILHLHMGSWPTGGGDIFFLFLSLFVTLPLLIFNILFFYLSFMNGWSQNDAICFSVCPLDVFTFSWPRPYAQVEGCYWLITSIKGPRVAWGLFDSLTEARCWNTLLFLVFKGLTWRSLWRLRHFIGLNRVPWGFFVSTLIPLQITLHNSMRVQEVLLVQQVFTLPFIWHKIRLKGAAFLMQQAGTCLSRGD